MGRLSREKGVKTLIDSMKDIKYNLVIAGTGPLESTLKEYVVNNNINNVEFKGFITGEPLYTLVKKSRCVVLPSEWYENGPYSAMEALGNGKPLIVSNIGGLPEMVVQGENGLIYNSQIELVECLKYMISLNKEEYEKYCEKAYNRAIELFDPNKYLKELLESKYYE